jgi:Flp pilus assembly pilin Flp
MFYRLLKNKVGQNTAEYALLIALVVAGVIAMQTYAQRSLQARVRDASQYLVRETTNTAIGLNGTDQYEPYYQQSNYEISRESVENTRLAPGLVAKDTVTNRTRGDKGYQVTTYNASTDGPTGGTDGH